MKRSARFSFTMPSELAKKAGTWLMKCRSPSVSLAQCRRSLEVRTGKRTHIV